jgi:hypothetical protein
LSTNIGAIEIIRKNLHKINWHLLSLNMNAIEILCENKNKINYFEISYNPSIFELDYSKMKKNFQKLADEIIAKALHPDRIAKYMRLYNYQLCDWF